MFRASDSSDTYTDMCVCVCMSVMEWNGMGWDGMLCHVVMLFYVMLRTYVCMCVSNIVYKYTCIYIYTYVCIFT